MSLVRNERSTTNKTLTAKRFVAGQAISTQTMMQNFRIVEYLQMNHGYLGDGHDYINLNNLSSIIFKCEFSLNANGGTNTEGYLFGRTDGLKITTLDNVVYWKNGSTTLHSVERKDGMHTYGYVRVTGGVAPYYDGQIISLQTPISIIPIAPLYIGIAVDPNGQITGNPLTGMYYGVRIQEIEGYIYNSYINDNEICHWYAARRTGQSYCKLMETRSSSDVADLSAYTGQGRDYSYGNDVTYGMQLEDLREISNPPSPYRDLLMILSNDGGIDTRAGFKASLSPVEFPDWDRVAATKETFTKDNLLHSTAFYIPADIIEGVSSVTPPTGTWEVGQLFKGRSPRWSIWNDAIKFGKHIVGGMNSTDKKILFNVFKDMYGRNMLTYEETDVKKVDHLFAFDGYNNAQTTRTKDGTTVSNYTAGYPPFIEVMDGTTQNITFHCDTAYDTTIANPPRSYQWSAPYIMAFDTSSVGANIRACLGGIPFWQLSRNYGSSEPHADDFDVVDITGDITAQAPTIYGLLCKIQSRGTELEWADVATATAVTDDDEKYPDNRMIPLSKDSSTAMVNKFKINGAELTLQFVGYNQYLRVSVEDDFIARVKMCAMLSRDTSSISPTSLIDCSSLVAPQPINISVQRNFDSLMLVGEKLNDTYGCTSSGEKIYLNIARGSVEGNAFTHSIDGQVETSLVTWETICGLIQLKRGSSFLPIFGEFHTITDWYSFFLTGDINKVIVGPKSSWSATAGDASCHYVDSDTYTIWHWDSYDNEYYEDKLDDVTDKGGESFIRDYEDPEYDFTFKIRGSDNYGPYIKYYRFSEQKVGQGKTGLNRYAITLVRDYMDCDYVAYIEMTTFMCWQSMIGAPSDKLHIVKGLPSSGTAGHYYVNVNDSRIYQRIEVSSGRWTWVEDAEENVASINELLTKTDYHKTYHLSGTYRYFRRSELAVSGGKTDMDTFIELPQWFSRGVCLGRYSGFAKIFNQLIDTEHKYIGVNDVSQVYSRSTYIEYPGEHDTTIYFDDNDKFGVFTFYKPYLLRDVRTKEFDKYLDGYVYDYVTHQDVPHYAHQPNRVRLRIFNKNDMPWSWALYRSDNVSFSDQGENWFIGLAPTTIGSTTYYQKALLVINDDFLMSGGRSVVGMAARAYVRAENGGYNEVGNYDSYFSSFYLSLYRQTPCEPYESDGRFDKNLQMTNIFKDKYISVSAGQYGQAVRIDGTEYSIKISVINYSGMAFGLTNEPVNKFMNYNTTCYYIEIIYDYNPGNGVTYIAKIEPYNV